MTIVLLGLDALRFNNTNKLDYLQIIWKTDREMPLTSNKFPKIAPYRIRNIKWWPFNVTCNNLYNFRTLFL